MTPEVLLLFFAIGFLNGLRTMSPPAAVVWGAYLGWINLHNTPFAFLHSTIALAIFTAAALAEFIADQLPTTPARIVPMQLGARIVMAGCCGAVLGLYAGHSAIIGILIAAVGALAGAFGGYHARVGLVRSLKVPDIVIALPEDLLAIGGALFVVSRF